MNLSHHNNDVCGFDSTWEQEKQVLVRDAGTETDATKEETASSSNQAIETKEIGIQAAPIVVSNSDEETDRKLAAWLKKILPAVEKELKEGLTQVYESDTSSLNRHVLSVGSFQEIDLKSHFSETNEKQIIACATWLSVAIQSNPVLVISCSSTKASINEQKNAFLILYEPQRSKVDGNIYWQEVSCIPVKDTIDYLITNPENRDMFAGASNSGDLYIWNYNKNSTAESRIEEMFSKASEDSIVGISFLSGNNFIACLADGSMIVYKIISKQNCVVDKTLKIEANKLKESNITAIASLSGTNDFVIGLMNGKLYLCSSNIPHGMTDPIIRELNPHKFSVRYIKHCQMSNKNYIASCDNSSAIFIHEIDEEFEKSTLKLVITLPLPIKHSLSITNNMEYILCPLTNSGLEIFHTMTNTRRTLEGSNSGNGVISELSRNEAWLITGIYNGTLKIYYVSNDDD